MPRDGRVTQTWPIKVLYSGPQGLVQRWANQSPPWNFLLEQNGRSSCFRGHGAGNSCLGPPALSSWGIPGSGERNQGHFTKQGRDTQRWQMGGERILGGTETLISAVSALRTLLSIPQPCQGRFPNTERMTRSHAAISPSVPLVDLRLSRSEQNHWLLHTAKSKPISIVVLIPLHQVPQGK